MRLAIIPARGGSKSIPRKNIRPFAGRPIIAWSIVRLTDIQAALGLSQLRKIERFLARRQELAARYRRELARPSARLMDALPEAERYYREALSIPLYYDLSDAQQSRFLADAQTCLP